MVAVSPNQIIIIISSSSIYYYYLLLLLLRVCPFFSYKIFFTLFDEGAAKTAEPILTRNTSFDAVW